MKISIILLKGPYQHQSSDTARLFIESALKKGHEIQGVFFYQDGVLNANKHMDPPQDDRNLGKFWQQLAEKNNEMIVCIAAGKRRGINEEICIPGIKISGLGQLAKMIKNSDRVITF
ncbi:MAG: sulfurtransferase complex subunit TusD [Methylococcales bacterium]|jgi:tRNA 2-thiouridine synthesizing protein D|nr:sulfurtransferase complex subunit TusD [Methylococcales bacterium]MBT7408347.1 sulfurtransferase complex subunit TusD [Methylococcales bacterium]